jgi:hypothetical protein
MGHPHTHALKQEGKILICDKDKMFAIQKSGKVTPM